MKEPLTDFEWYVAPTYQWQDWMGHTGNPVVVPAEGLFSLESPSGVEHVWGQFLEKERVAGPILGPVLDSGPAETYRPMRREHASLFRTFADLDYLDKDAILRFASNYGLLGVKQHTQSVRISDHTDGKSHRHVVGESYLDWAREICAMQEAFRLARVKTPDEDGTIRTAYAKHKLKPPYEQDRQRLAWLFNQHLQWVQARIVLEADALPRVSFAPLTLLAAMWLQLALSLAGNKQFRACKNCHKLFEISTEDTGFRSHREFCSESCKTLDYRKRKREALKLASGGKSAAAIAKRLKTSPTTVKAWLVGSRRREKGKK